MSHIALLLWLFFLWHVTRQYSFPASRIKENKKTAWAEAAAGVLLIAARTNCQQVKIKVGVLQELRY
jgi:hypothetical protein